MARRLPDPEETLRPTKPDRPAVEPAGTDSPPRPREIGGPKGPEPTRYGDWEIGGRCIDF